MPWGSNRDAARLAGINFPTEMIVYAFMGLITAIASIVFLGRVGQATAMVGQSFESLAQFTGCIVGGTSTLGGSGTVIERHYRYDDDGKPGKRHESHEFGFDISVYRKKAQFF